MVEADVATMRERANRTALRKALAKWVAGSGLGSGLGSGSRRAVPAAPTAHAGGSARRFSCARACLHHAAGRQGLEPVTL